MHGLKQRVSDAAALSRNATTGKSATPEEKRVAMSELIEHYNSGTADWNRARRAGARATRDSDAVMLLAALARLYPERTEEQLKTWVEKRSKADRAALMLSEKIKPIIEELREAQGASADANDLLMDLETLSDEAS